MLAIDKYARVLVGLGNYLRGESEVYMPCSNFKLLIYDRNSRVNRPDPFQSEVKVKLSYIIVRFKA